MFPNTSDEFFALAVLCLAFAAGHTYGVGGFFLILGGGFLFAAFIYYLNEK